MYKIYLDHNATTPLRPEVFKEMSRFYDVDFGNASSLHTYGRTASDAIEEARLKVAGLLGGSEPVDVVFTSGGTESNNFAIKGVANALRPRGRHIITTSIEHLAVLNVCEFLKKDGFDLSYIPVNKYGIIDLNILSEEIRNDTILISVMLANNEIGTLEPLDEIARIAKKRGILLHTDAVQAAGKINLNMGEISADLVSISAHKLYGPKGVGALYIKKGTLVTPLIHGGHHERNRRAGTENVPGIAGFGRACELVAGGMESEKDRITGLRNRLKAGIEREIPDVCFNGHPGSCLPNTLNVSFKGISAEGLLYNLDLKGIAVSGGSACTSGSLNPSHVLEAIGIEDSYIRGSIRFSLGITNKEKDIDIVINETKNIVERLRRA